MVSGRARGVAREKALGSHAHWPLNRCRGIGLGRCGFLFACVLAAIDLCCKLLVVDPIQRFSVGDALEHQWFQTTSRLMIPTEM